MPSARAGAESMPVWTDLRDEVLLELLTGSTAPRRRHVLVQATAARDRFPPRVRRVPAPDGGGLHTTHLQQRIDRTIDQMRVDGHITNPVRGSYVLTPKGKRAANELRRERETKAPSPLVTKTGSARLHRSTKTHTHTPVQERLGELFGAPYTEEPAARSKEPAPFSWDPDEKDRSTQAHRDVLRRFDAALREEHVTAYLPRDQGARFDIAFEVAWEVVVVVEAKSLPHDHEVHQLRLGLGQLLDYRTRSRKLAPDHAVMAVLAVPRKATDHVGWKQVCADADVELVVMAGDVQADARAVREVIRKAKAARRSERPADSPPASAL